jgi:CRP-like cAMP-binding protein
MDFTAEMLVHFLEKTQVFSDFEPEEIAEFLPHFEFIDVEEDHTIFHEGSSGDGWWMILEGEVGVTKEMFSGPPHVLAHLEAGDCFGEMALIDGAPRMATTHTVVATRLVRLSRTAFMDLLRAKQMSAIKLLWALSMLLCERQRDLTAVLSDIVEVPDEEAVREHELLSQLLKANVTWN